MNNIPALLLALLFLTGLAGCGGGDSASTTPSPNPPRPKTTCVAGNAMSFSGVRHRNAFPNLSFNQPVAMIQQPGTNTLYVVERSGTIRAFDHNPAVATTTLFADITGRVSTTGEGGLLGMAFDPNFSSNGFVYLSYTAASATAALETRISRFNTNAARTAILTNTEEMILQVDQPYSNHNGGMIAFDSNGHLFIGLGDGGDGNDTDRHGQNTSTLLGAMLRIIPSTATPPSPAYSIPAGNPFSGNTNCTGGCPEIFAWGLRNPWRWSIDRATNQVWVGDVGQVNREEIDLLEAGKNYGWGCYEGTRFNTEYAGACPNNLVHEPPVFEYPRSDGNSITGGYVYRGTAVSTLSGDYVYTDFGSGTVWALANPYTNPVRRTLMNAGSTIAAMAEDAAGELYLLYTFSSGEIHIIEEDPTSTPLPPFATQLSQTGCADPSDPRLARSGQIPYQINAPLWSDNAEKQRWLALPNNQTITIDTNHDWELPAGTVLRKDFAINGTLIETRLLAHHNDGTWSGYSYEWNATQTDATLLNSGKTVSNIQNLNQDWTFPSQAQCLQCHTAVAKHALGTQTAQLNRLIDNPNGSGQVNQLNYFTNLGLFTSPPGDPTGLPALAEYDDAMADVELKARAYLHSNCSHCHQPGGPAQGNMDLLYSTPLLNMNICDATPVAGNINGASLLLDPGNTDNSIIYQRMLNASGSARMPPLAVAIEDGTGLDLLFNWINMPPGCP